MTPLRLRYQTLEVGEHDIHLRGLRDLLQFEDVDDVAAQLGISSAAWPMFGVLWDSGRVLAELMLSQAIEGKRILEVGCGLGLASMLLNRRCADITATDHHPSAGVFLQANTVLNADAAIPFCRASWEDEDTGLGLFDLVIGADLLYTRHLIAPLAGFIHRHAASTSEVLIVDPGRTHRGRFASSMAGHGFDCERTAPGPVSQLSAPFRGQLLTLRRSLGASSSAGDSRPRSAGAGGNKEPGWG
jgi:predicted nicotinamide N-methyase